MLREEYDALTQSHLDKGETYRRQVAEEATLATAILDDPNRPAEIPPGLEVPAAPAVAADPATAHRIIEGVHIDDLLPGMAIGGSVRRKRGWAADVRVADWTRVIRA